MMEVKKGEMVNIGKWPEILSPTTLVARFPFVWKVRSKVEKVERSQRCLLGLGFFSDLGRQNDSLFMSFP